MNDTSDVSSYIGLSEDDLCAVETNNRRWYMVAIAGSSLSLVSLLTNLVIAKVLLASQHGHFFFLALLAISDSFLSFMYGPVIAMDIIKDRVQELWLNKLYWGYVGPLLSLCQVSMTFSTYLIILATIERYLITQRSSYLKSFRKSRGAWSFFMFSLALLLRGTLFFEIEITKNADSSGVECTGLMEFLPGLSPLVDTYWYGTIFRFYIRNILTVFLPFVLLAYLNYRIVRTLRKQQRSAQMFRFLSSNHKEKIRSATRLMVVIVCSYLVANILNVLITLWEYVSFSSTQTKETYVIYETCTDVVSVLYVFVCASRLAVYVVYNKEIREELKSFWNKKKCFSGEKRILSVNGSSSRQVGTDIDAVTIAIARRLIGYKDPERPDSPVQAIIYANRMSKDYTFL